MVVSKNEKFAQDFIDTVDSTNQLITSLIAELKYNGSSDLSSIKTQIQNLAKNIEKSAETLEGARVDISELKIKIAVLENTVEDLENIKLKNHQLQAADKTGRWGVIAVTISSLTALVVSVINIIFNFLK